MAKLNDLTSNKVQERKRQVRTYGTKTDLASTVVERGSTHWAEGSNVHIDGLLGVAGTATVSGTLRVTGLLDVTGTLNASGQINLSGSTGITGPLNVTGTTTIGGNTNITGELNVTGPTTLDGVLDIGGDTTITGLLSIEGDSTISGKLDVTGAMSTKGTLSVEGVTTLKNDLNVTAEGRIQVGDLVIDQSSPGGNIGFAGAGITSGPLGFRFTATSKDAVVESVAPNGSATLAASGSSVVARAGAIDLNATKTWVNGQIEVTGTARFSGPNVYLPTTLSVTTQKANLYVDANGRIFKSSAV